MNPVHHERGEVQVIERPQEERTADRSHVQDQHATTKGHSANDGQRQAQPRGLLHQKQ